MPENQEQTQATVESKKPKTIELTIAGLKEDLKNGINRKDQAKKYGVPLAAINRAYKNEPELKGKRVFSPRGSSAVNIVFTDKTQDEASNTETEASQAPEQESVEQAPETQATSNSDKGW